MKKIIAVLAFGLMLNGAVHADQFDDGFEAYGKGNYKQAHKLWLPFAEQGDASAQYNIGRMYFKGEGTQKNVKQAFNWFKKAAEQGHAEAKRIIGVL